MTAILSALISQLNASVFVLLVILAFLIIGAYKIGGWSKTFKHHREKIDKLESVSDKVIELKTKIDLIYQNTNPRKLTQAYSPVSLTDLGIEIAAKINADKIFKKYSEELLKDTDIPNLKNAYDIQQSSMKIAKEKILSLLNEEELIIIKKEAFNNGLIVEDLTSIFGILLRNKILKDKKIPLAEIDNNEPKEQEPS